MLYFIAIDSRSFVLIKLITAAIVAYAISPIDLIPDFIPVLGYLDELILLPLSIMIILKFVPDVVRQEAGEKAEKFDLNKLPASRWVIYIVIIFWVLIAALSINYFF